MKFLQRTTHVVRQYPLETLVLAVGAVLRLFWLDLKPTHFDEGVNGWFIDQMTQTGTFTYDPENYHGPLHFYVLFLAQTLFGRDICVLRLPVVLVSFSSLGLILSLGKYLGRRTVLIAAAVLAVSPAFVFYGRYAIHEAWLVLFLILCLRGILRLMVHNDRAGIWMLTAGVTGAILTKETYIIHLLAYLLAWFFLCLYQRWVPSRPVELRPVTQWTTRDLLVSIGCSLVVLIFFYSGNLRNWSGLFGPLQTFALWSKTGLEGHGHEKWFFYWVELMWTYEWPVLLGLAGCMRFLWPSASRHRYIVIYGAGTLLAYSLINYKTPWCGIAVFWPFALVLGAVMNELLNIKRTRVVAACLLAVALAHSLYASVRVNFFTYTDDREPYVYVQTYTDLREFTTPLLRRAASDDSTFHLPGAVIAGSYYPLPWLLGNFTKISWLGLEDMHSLPVSPAFVLAEESVADEVASMLVGDYFSADIRFRSAQEPCRYFLRADLFSEVMTESIEP